MTLDEEVPEEGETPIKEEEKEVKKEDKKEDKKP